MASCIGLDRFHSCDPSSGWPFGWSDRSAGTGSAPVASIASAAVLGDLDEAERHQAPRAAALMLSPRRRIPETRG